MPQCNAPLRVADCTRSLNEIFDLHRQHLSSCQTNENRCGRHANGNHGVGQAGAQKRRQRDGQNQKRHSQHGVSKTRNRPIDPAAYVTGQQPNGHAQGHGNGHRHQPGQQGSPGTPDHTREHITPDLVGAKQILRTGRLAHRTPAGLQRVLWCNHRRQKSDHNKHQHNGQAQHRATAAHQAKQGSAGR